MYQIYLTTVGRWLHNRDLASLRAQPDYPFYKWDPMEGAPTYKIGFLTVLPVAYLATNIAYIIYDE